MFSQLLPNDLVSAIVETIGLASILYSIYRLLVRRFFFNWYLRRIERRLSARPIALAIGVGRDIEAAAKQYLHDKSLLIDVVPYYKAPPAGQTFVPKSEFPEIIKEMHAIKEQMVKQSITELYIFYAGPISVSMAIGNVFRNFVPLKIYNHSNAAGGYDLDLKLERDGSAFTV
ncbi:MAG: hypothetical protein EXR62_09480 [Chloroflexi bacterium]|nr:hypothetical protein [Chloroflexota bacterium]